MPQRSGKMQEKDMITDALSTQKYLSSTYNDAANEASNPKLRRDFINILNDEHKNEEKLFDAMNQKGWYSPQNADQQRITQAYNKFSQKTGGS